MKFKIVQFMDLSFPNFSWYYTKLMEYYINEFGIRYRHEIINNSDGRVITFVDRSASKVGDKSTFQSKLNLCNLMINAK